jgi:hypothetical protein
VDPGDVFGVALYSVDDQDETLDLFELPPMDALKFIHTALDIATQYHIDGVILAVERYTPDQRVMTPQYEAMYGIGALRYIATLCNATFALQSRSEAKKTTDKQLKELGWYVKTKDGHANDAARHVAHAMLVHYPVEWIRRLEPFVATS